MEDKILEPDDYFLSVNGEEPSSENPYIFASSSKKLFIKNERCKNSEKLESMEKSILVWKEFSAEAHETCHNEAYDFIFGHLYSGSEDYYSDEKFDTSDYEDTSEDEIQVSASKSSEPVVIFKNFWEEIFLIESSLVSLESSTATFTLEIYSFVDDQKRTYSGDKNRQFQISILLHDFNNEIIYLSWKTIKAKRKQITFKLENLEKAASISLRQASVEVNGSQICFGKSNCIKIDDQIKLAVTGPKFKPEMEVINAHKPVQLRIGFSFSFLFSKDGENKPETSFSHSARIPLQEKTLTSRVNIYGSYEQPKTKCPNFESTCVCSRSKTHDFKFSVEAGNHSSFVQWKLEQKSKVRKLRLWSSYVENGVESSCGPIHLMKIDAFSLGVSIAGVVFSIIFVTCSIFFCLFRYLKKVKKETKCKKPRIIIYDDCRQEDEKSEAESETLDILPPTSTFSPVNIHRLIWGSSSSESSLEDISPASPLSADDGYVDMNLMM